MLVPDGFPGQRLRVLPEPLERSMLSAPITSRLLVTDAGYFPHAVAHGRGRPDGTTQTILILCTEGAGWYRARGEPVRVGPGHALMIPAGIPHEYVADDAEPWTIWFLHVTGRDVQDFVRAICAGDDDGVVMPVRDLFSATANVEAAVRAMENEETTASLYDAAGAAWRLLASLSADRLRGPAQPVDRIRLAQDYLRDNLATRLSVTDLARIAGLSPSHFSVRFKAATGLGVIEYVRRMRVARARELLLTTDGSVASVAEAVGYPDPFYFTRQFRAVNGLPPSEFRRRARGEEL